MTGTGEIGRAQKAIAADGGHHIGDLASWNIANVDCPRERATAIFAEASLPGLLPEIGLDAAITRAAAEGRRPDGLVCRAFEQPNSDAPVAVGIYRVTACEGESGDQHSCVARVRPAAATTPYAVALAPEGHVGQNDEQAMVWALDIARRANHLLANVASRDVSGAMVRALAAIGACPLRERGGFYLVPPAQCARWRRLACALEGIGVEPIIIEMHDAPSNVQAAARAATCSLEADLAELQQELQSAIELATTKTRKRDVALGRRIELSRSLAQRAKLFQHLLGQKSQQIADLAAQHAACFERVLDGDVTFLLPGAVPEPEQDSDAGTAAPPASEQGDGCIAAAASGGDDIWSL